MNGFSLILAPKRSSPRLTAAAGLAGARSSQREELRTDISYSEETLRGRQLSAHHRVQDSSTYRAHGKIYMTAYCSPA